MIASGVSWGLGWSRTPRLLLMAQRFTGGLLGVVELQEGLLGVCDSTTTAASGRSFSIWLALIATHSAARWCPPVATASSNVANANAKSESSCIWWRCRQSFTWATAATCRALLASTTWWPLKLDDGFLLPSSMHRTSAGVPPHCITRLLSRSISVHPRPPARSLCAHVADQEPKQVRPGLSRSHCSPRDVEEGRLLIGHLVATIPLVTCPETFIALWLEAACTHSPGRRTTPQARWCKHVGRRLNQSIEPVGQGPLRLELGIPDSFIPCRQRHPICQLRQTAIASALDALPGMSPGPNAAMTCRHCGGTRSPSRHAEAFASTISRSSVPSLWACSRHFWVTWEYLSHPTKETKTVPILGQLEPKCGMIFFSDETCGPKPPKLDTCIAYTTWSSTFLGVQVSNPETQQANFKNGPFWARRPPCNGMSQMDWHWLFVGANLCAGNPPNFQKIWPEQTEKPHSSHGSNCTFCDLDGRKLLNQLTLGCGKGHGA